MYYASMHEYVNRKLYFYNIPFDIQSFVKCIIVKN